MDNPIVVKGIPDKQNPDTAFYLMEGSRHLVQAVGVECCPDSLNGTKHLEESTDIPAMLL